MRCSDFTCTEDLRRLPTLIGTSSRRPSRYGWMAVLQQLMQQSDFRELPGEASVSGHQAIPTLHLGEQQRTAPTERAPPHSTQSSPAQVSN